MNSMKCYQCGFVAWADTETCKRCGVSLLPDSADGPYPTRPGYINCQPANRGSFHPELKKGLAICSLVAGIFNFFTLGLLGPGALVGITLGIVTLRKIKRNPLKYGGKELAIAGLLTSALSVVMIIPFGLVAAIAIPNLLASVRAANEGSSINVLRTISNAEATYQSVHGTYGTLDQLALDQLIDADIAAGTRHGYKFKIGVSALGPQGPTGFEAVGVPANYPTSGRRSFFIDETGVVRASDNRGADATRFDSPLNFDSGYSSSPRRSRSDDSGAGY